MLLMEIKIKCNDVGTLSFFTKYNQLNANRLYQVQERTATVCTYFVHFMPHIKMSIYTSYVLPSTCFYFSIVSSCVSLYLIDVCVCLYFCPSFLLKVNKL